MPTRVSKQWHARVLKILERRPSTAPEMAKELGTTEYLVRITLYRLRQEGKVLVTDRVDNRLGTGPRHSVVSLYGIPGVHAPYVPDRLLKNIAQRARARTRQQARAGSGQIAGKPYYRQLANWG